MLVDEHGCEIELRWSSVDHLRARVTRLYLDVLRRRSVKVHAPDGHAFDPQPCRRLFKEIPVSSERRFVRYISGSVAT